MKTERFYKQNAAWVLQISTTYTYKSYEAFSPPGVSMSGSAIDEIKTYDYDEDGTVQWQEEAEYDYTDL